MACYLEYNFKERYSVHWKNCISSTVWKFYFQSVPGIFPIPRKTFPYWKWNWTKLWKLHFPTFSYNISKIFPYYGRGTVFPVVSMWLEFARPANQHPKRTIKKKGPQTFAHLVGFLKKCLPCLIITQSCYFDYRINKPFACFRCVICISCSVHVI